jgi:hypothetical protein
MKAKHTPGPWKLIELSHKFIIPAIEVEFPRSHSTDSAQSRKLQSERAFELANARLIAASPELLLNLKRIVNLYAKHSELDAYECEIIAKCSRSIAKAEGKDL